MPSCNWKAHGSTDVEDPNVIMPLHVPPYLLLITFTNSFDPD